MIGGPYTKDHGTVLYSSFNAKFLTLPNSSPDYFAHFANGSTLRGRIYAATLGSDSIYRLEGLRLTDGLEQLNTVITTPAGGFDWTIEQERGALAVANGYVYVPMGGRAGDCGSYHGYVFAVPIDGSTVTHYYQTPGQGMGIWAAGGVVVDSSTGKVFVSTGNGTGSGCNANGNGTATYENDAIVRLSSTLAHEEAQSRWEPSVIFLRPVPSGRMTKRSPHGVTSPGD